jgi:hypothetical protein
MPAGVELPGNFLHLALPIYSILTINQEDEHTIKTIQNYAFLTPENKGFLFS